MNLDVITDRVLSFCDSAVEEEMRRWSGRVKVFYFKCDSMREYIPNYMNLYTKRDLGNEQTVRDFLRYEIP